ncbi:MAG: hypothetical protein QXT06_04310 [Candidatus Bathyarchaeia archaeon]
MKRFGREYAEQVISNSRELAKALYEYGFPVKCLEMGFTNSHQLILDFETPERSREFADKLERANIIVDTAVRIGRCEVTRRGMKTPEMLKIAELIKRAVDGENPENIKREVSKLCYEFRDIKYCF